VSRAATFIDFKRYLESENNMTFNIDVILGCAFITMSIGLAVASYLTRDKKEDGQ